MAGPTSPPAATRWAHCVLSVLDASSDPRTLADWSRIAGVSSGTLRDRCRAAGLRPKKSLDFARLLRAVASGSEDTEPWAALDVLHARTLRRLLDQGGVIGANGRQVSVESYVARQQFVADRHALAAILAGLRKPEP
jgi:hypothetical protein